MESASQIVHVGRFSKLCPRVNFANYMVAEASQSWGPRIIPDCQLVYVLSGQATLVLGGTTYDVGAGQGLFYGDNSPHVLVSSVAKPMTFSSIHFLWDADDPEPVHPGPAILNCSMEEIEAPTRSYCVDLDGFGEVLFPHVFSQPGLDDLFLQIVREYRNEELVYSVVMRSLLMELLTQIFRSTLRPEARPEVITRLAPALQAIGSQPHVNWSISTLADMCGYNPNYFGQLFKSTFGYSPKHYIMLERVRQAKLLLPARRTIEEVADELGYSSTHYFCRQFRLITGTTPAAYRNQHLEL